MTPRTIGRKTALCERIAAALIYIIAGTTLAAVLSSCATTNVVPGVSVGGSADETGSVEAHISVDPGAFACWLVEISRIQHLTGVTMCLPSDVTDPAPAPVELFPVATVARNADLLALRSSQLAGHWPVVPNLAYPIAPDSGW